MKYNTDRKQNTTGTDAEKRSVICGSLYVLGHVLYACFVITSITLKYQWFVFTNCCNNRAVVYIHLTSAIPPVVFWTIISPIFVYTFRVQKKFRSGQQSRMVRYTLLIGCVTPPENSAIPQPQMCFRGTMHKLADMCYLLASVLYSWSYIRYVWWRSTTALLRWGCHHI